MKLEILHIEPSYLCHLSCPQCIPSKLRKSLKEGPYHLTQEMYAGFLRQLRREIDTIRIVHFEGRGDPLNNKQMGELVRLTKQFYPSAIAKITTHGNFPFKPWMIESGLDYLRVSVDGAFPDSYAKYRVGGRLETAVKLLRDLRDEKRRTGAIVYVEWKYILFEWNDTDDELRDAARLARELDVQLRFCRTHSPGRSQRFPDDVSVTDMIARLAPTALQESTDALKRLSATDDLI
jgi:MoaA/NifB/PqqE/SkfB family radical SAM enzyme